MKRKIKKMKAYLPFTKCGLQQKLIYKFNFFMTFIGQVIKCLIVLFLWKAVFDNSDSEVIKRFTVSEMMIYIFMSAVTLNMTANSTDAFISYEVRDGKIGLDMIKPISLHCKLFFDAMADFISGTLFTAFPLWIGMIFVTYFVDGNVPVRVENFFLFVISAFMGFIVLYLFNFCFGILSFFVTNIWGIRNLKHSIINFLSGSVIPLAFFPDLARNVLELFPFASINYTPVMIYLGKVAGTDMLRFFGIQILWIIILYFLSHALWNKATNHLTMLGG